MKKILAVGMAAAIGLSSAAAFAQSNVYSRNAVGYITVTVPPSGQFTLAGFNFKPVGGDTTTLLDIFGTNQLVQTTGSVVTRASRIYLWDPSGASGNGDYLEVYQRTNGLFYTAFGAIQTNPVIRAGAAFWIQSPNLVTTNSTVTFAGEVVSTNAIGQMLPTGFQMIANPYAAPLDLNDTNLDWVASGATASNIAARADQVFIWRGTDYLALFLKNSDNKWHYQFGSVLASNAVLNPGVGAWYKAKRPFTNSLVRPYPWW